jgi:dynein heavy chain
VEDYVAITLAVNERERLFGFEVSKFEMLQTIQLDLEPFSLLWLTSMDFKLALPDWKFGPFLQINAEDVQAKMSSWLRACSKLERIFADSPSPLTACSALRSQLESFATFLPIIEALRTPGLKDRHWQQLSAEIGHDIRPEASLALQFLVELGVPAHLSTCSSIAEIAAKEHSFERALERMRTDWGNITFDLMPYKDSETYVLRSTDDITLLLDDHILKAQVNS